MVVYGQCVGMGPTVGNKQVTKSNGGEKSNATTTELCFVRLPLSFVSGNNNKFAISEQLLQYTQISLTLGRRASAMLSLIGGWQYAQNAAGLTNTPARKRSALGSTDNCAHASLVKQASESRSVNEKESGSEWAAAGAVGWVGPYGEQQGGLGEVFWVGAVGEGVEETQSWGPPV